MLDERRVDLRSIPTGMFRSQNAIGSPNTIVSTPTGRRWAAAASPYGPAPMTAASAPKVPIPSLLLITLPAHAPCSRAQTDLVLASASCVTNLLSRPPETGER